MERPIPVGPEKQEDLRLKPNGTPSDRSNDIGGSWSANPLMPGLPLDQIGQALASTYDNLVAEGIPEHLAALVRRVEEPRRKGVGTANRLAIVVEDDPDIRAQAEALLEETELGVIGCDSAERALAVLQECGGDVALVFADVRLTGAMDGIQLAHAVSTLWPKTRLVVTSGAACERSHEIPAQAVFIPKPWRPHDVLAEVERATAESPPAVA